MTISDRFIVALARIGIPDALGSQLLMEATAQIQEMAVGDLMLTREENGTFVLNYDIEQSDDLNNWSTHSTNAEPLTGLPTDKAFVRIKLKK